MKQLIKKVDNSITIAFDTGAFDDWCVYVTSPKRGKFAPTDSEYFTRLNLIGEEFGHQTIYNDFIKIYDLTTSTVDSVVLDSITDISRGYGTRSLEMEVWFTVIYAGMIAEENKANSKLKKKIKRLGMHQLLVDKESPAYAANFSKGKKAKDLELIMHEKGF